jgi:divalent metal cation (Fe/Co/Zn/Cd) transporter
MTTTAPKDVMAESRPRDTRDWARIGRRLVILTLAYNIIEAVVALVSGARAESVALLGFGLDSLIECVAAVALLWRLTVEGRGADRETIEVAERRVHQVVGWSFLALALYVVGESVWTLWRREPPAASTVGILLAVASLIIMPLIAWRKLKAAAKIPSPALRAEAKETLACSYLSFALLLGLSANAVAGWWWADPLAALLMVPWLVKEGREGLSGGCHDECGCD